MSKYITLGIFGSGQLGSELVKSAKKLGLKKRTIQYYEKGKRDGKEFKIPKTTELACYAVSVGIEHYFGPVSLNTED